MSLLKVNDYDLSFPFFCSLKIVFYRTELELIIVELKWRKQPLPQTYIPKPQRLSISAAKCSNITNYLLLKCSYSPKCS